MDYVKSLYKLTFSPASSPVVLLDFGQWVSEELVIDLDKAVELVPLADAKDVFIRDALTSVWNFSIKTYTTEALDLDARVAAMQSQIAVSALGKKPLKLEINGYAGHSWQWASCAITKHRPVRVLQSAVARWERQFDIVATGLTYT